MNEILKQALLYDFYGELLTEHQKEIYSRFALEDLSLADSLSQRICPSVRLQRKRVSAAREFTTSLSGAIGRLQDMKRSFIL